MFTLLKEEFVKYLNKGKINILYNGEEYRISYNATHHLCFDENHKFISSTTKFSGYFINDITVNSAEELLEYFGNPVEFNVLSIRNFTNLEDFLLDDKLSNATMEVVLDTFSDCDKFSLVKVFEPGYSLTKEEAQKAYDNLVAYNDKILIERYNKFKDEYNLEPFEAIKKNIEIECQAFKSKYYDYYINKYGSFNYRDISSHVGKGTNYNEPTDLFDHFYSMYGNHIDVKEELEKLLNIDYNNKIIEQLDSFEELKNNFIEYELTYRTYAYSGPLMIIYYFKLNEQTKKFLLNFVDDYSFSIPLDDLGLYKNGKLVYASCGHERFRYFNRN